MRKSYSKMSFYAEILHKNLFLLLKTVRIRELESVPGAPDPALGAWEPKNLKSLLRNTNLRRWPSAVTMN
jgi:hypothetical protein